MGIKSASSDNVLFHTKKMGIKSASSDNATHPQINPNRLENKSLLENKSHNSTCAGKPFSLAFCNAKAPALMMALGRQTREPTRGGQRGDPATAAGSSANGGGCSGRPRDGGAVAVDSGLAAAAAAPRLGR